MFKKTIRSLYPRVHTVQGCAVLLWMKVFQIRVVQ